jgi:hypothetical protein
VISTLDFRVEGAHSRTSPPSSRHAPPLQALVPCQAPAPGCALCEDASLRGSASVEDLEGGLPLLHVRSQPSPDVLLHIHQHLEHNVIMKYSSDGFPHEEYADVLRLATGTMRSSGQIFSSLEQPAADTSVIDLKLSDALTDTKYAHLPGSTPSAPHRL